MPTLPAITREQIKIEDQPEFDETVEIRGRIDGLYAHLLYSPKLAATINRFNQCFPRYSIVPLVQREVVILTTARDVRTQYLYTFHVGIARNAGLSEEVIQAITNNTAPEGLAPDQTLLYNYTQELVRDPKPSDGTFGAMKELFGAQATVEVTGLVFYYMMLCNLLKAFEVPLPPDKPAELPM